MNIFSVIFDSRTETPFAVVVQQKNNVKAIGLSERGKKWAQTSARKYKTLADVISALDVNYYATDSKELSDSALSLMEDVISVDVRTRLLEMVDTTHSFEQPSIKTHFGDVSNIPLVFSGHSRKALINFKAAAFRYDIQASSILLEEKAGRIGRARRSMQAFDPNAIDADADGRVQDNTPFERPATGRGVVDALVNPRERRPIGSDSFGNEYRNDKVNEAWVRYKKRGGKLDYREWRKDFLEKNPELDNRNYNMGRYSGTGRMLDALTDRGRGTSSTDRRSTSTPTVTPSTGTPPNGGGPTPPSAPTPGLQRRVGRRIRKVGTAIEDRGKERDKRRLQRRVAAQQAQTGTPSAPSAPNLPNGTPSSGRVPRGARRGRRGGRNVQPVSRTTAGNVPAPKQKPGKKPVGRTIITPPAAPPKPKRQKRGSAPKKKVRDRIRDRLDTFADDIATPGAVTARRQQRRAARRTGRTQRGTSPAPSSGAAAKPKRRGPLQTLEEFAQNIGTPGKVTAERRRRRDARRAAKGRGARRTAATQKARITQRPQPGKKVYGQRTNWDQLSDAQKKAVKREAIKRLAELEAKWQKRLGKGPDDDVLESEIQDYIDEQIRKGASQARLGVLRADYNDGIALAEMENADDFSQLDRVGPTRRKAILTDANAIAKPRPPAKPKPKPKKPKPAPATPTPTPSPSPKPKPKPKPKPTPKTPTPKKPTPKKPTPKKPTPKKPTSKTPTPASPAGPTGPSIGGTNVKMPTYTEVTSWTKISGPTGSQGGQWYRDPATGREFLVKPTQSKERAQNEAAVAAFYRAAGVKVPNVSAVDDGSGNHFIISEKVDIQPWSKTPANQAAAKEAMGLDMLISNWDAFGVGGQNLGVDANGNIVRIDHGGGGKFRATGAKKPDFDPNKPWKETSTMIDSPFGKEMYGDVTNQEFADAMRAAADLDLNAVDTEMTNLGIDAATRKEILDVLRARQIEAAKYADDFDKYDPNAKVVITKGNPIAPGGNQVRKTTRKRGGGKKVSQITNPAERAPGARKRAIATIAKLLERNRSGSVMGDDLDKPKLTREGISGLVKFGKARSEDKRMEAFYEMHGFSGQPVRLTASEVQELIDQGWKPILRGVKDKYVTPGVDPTNPKQTTNQKQVWGWLAGNRFISGTGSSGANFGPGDYFATPAEASGSWFTYHTDGKPVNGLENNGTIFALIPPTAKMASAQKIDTIKREYTSHWSVINGMINPQYGGQKNWTIKGIEQELAKRGYANPRNNPATSILLDLLEAQKKAKTPKEQQEATEALSGFYSMTGGDKGYMALMLGYDGVDHGNGVLTMFNRTNMVALNEATNLSKAKQIINKTAKSKTDSSLQMR